MRFRSSAPYLTAYRAESRIPLLTMRQPTRGRADHTRHSNGQGHGRASTDPNCDQPPAQVGKADAAGSDDSPAALDPGDTWTYACSKKTTANADCTPSAVPNTGTVSGAAGGQAVSDRSRIQTSLGCPPQPKPPQPQPPNPGPQPTPTPPSPIVPPGPAPPDADAAGRAGVLVRRARQSCIRSPVPRVQIHGTRIARVQVYVDGQLQRTLTVDSLQSRSTPRVTLRRGSYGVKVRVTFQRGTASPPVTLSTSIRICARERAAPVFTG